MRRSKLEMYVDILNVLAQRGPLKVSHIMYKANVNCNILKEYLDFLIKQGLIEERVVGKSSVVYANTARGTEVIKFFRELDKALSVKRRRQNLSSFLLKRQSLFAVLHREVTDPCHGLLYWIAPKCPQLIFKVSNSSLVVVYPQDSASFEGSFTV